MSDVGVLLVDDQAPFRAAAAAVVEAMDGFTVVGTAESAEEALQLAETLTPDLVLMDVVLPRMSGLEATRLLRVAPRAPMVVLVSTYEAAEFGDDVSRCGAASYLVKSAFEGDQLAAIWRTGSR